MSEIDLRQAQLRALVQRAGKVQLRNETTDVQYLIYKSLHLETQAENRNQSGTAPIHLDRDRNRLSAAGAAGLTSRLIKTLDRIRRDHHETAFPFVVRTGNLNPDVVVVRSAEVGPDEM